uniref:Uncharacterized protein n=1 Tax=Anguilla anguilla TaxID=7936 RepID=A0A0E9TKS9_ANGAN
MTCSSSRSRIPQSGQSLKGTFVNVQIQMQTYMCIQSTHTKRI